VRGEPVWAKVLVFTLAWSLYLGAWALAEVVLSRRSAA